MDRDRISQRLAAGPTSAAAAARATAAPATKDVGPTWREVAGVNRRRRAQFAGRVARRLFEGAAIIGLSAASGAGAWTLIRGDLDAGRRDALSRVARSIAETSAPQAMPALAERDAEALASLARRLVAGGMVSSAGFLDADGRTLARHGPAEGAGAGPREQVVVRDGRRTLGTLWVTIDPAAALGRAEPAEHAVIAVAAAVAGTVAALGVWFSALHVRRRLAPVRALARAARRAGVDDSAMPADAIAAAVASADDDFAELCAAFGRLESRANDYRGELAAHDARAAEAIRTLEETLDQRASQLTAANERMMAEIAEKEDFVRAISHDLNAPLRNIGGMVTMMLNKHRAALPEEVAHKLERVKANVDHEAALIDELLEFSRIKTRRQSLQLVEVEKLVWELRGLFENDLKTKHIELRLETSLPNLFAERVRVRQIFQNLIDNAIKYMGEDRPRREILVGCRVGTAEAEFYVRDTGVGIEPADVDKVFYIFRRGTGPTTQRVAGKGVGLASVKSIVETYAGRIWVESELGVGTTFRFTVNGQYVPQISGQVPAEMNGQATRAAPSLSMPVAPVADPSRAA